MDWFGFGSPFVAFWVLPVPYSRVLGRGRPLELHFSRLPLPAGRTRPLYRPAIASTPRETDLEALPTSLARDERDREHGMLGGALG